MMQGQTKIKFMGH